MPKVRPNRVALVLGFGQDFWRDQRVQRTARALVAANYEVLVYTPAESKEHELSIGGIAVRYTKTVCGKSKLLKKFLLSYFLYDIRAALDMARIKVDICHCNDFDTLPCGVVLKIITLGRIKVIYDSHEDYPAFIEWGHGKLLAKVIELAEDIFTRIFVDSVIAVSEPIRDRFEKKGIRAEAVLNCQELLLSDLADDNQAAGDKKCEFKVVYQGKICPQKGYEQLIDAADILINNKRIEDVEFTLIGDSGPFKSYPSYLVKLIEDKGLQKYFTFTGFIDYEEMMRILRQSDIGVMTFEPTRKNKGLLPNKLFENLVAGIPTIASDLPGIARIINEEKCGLLVDATQPQEIADAIEYLYKYEDAKLEMGQNALRAARQKYNFAIQTEKLLGVYQDMANVRNQCNSNQD